MFTHFRPLDSESVKPETIKLKRAKRCLRRRFWLHVPTPRIHGPSFISFDKFPLSDVWT